MKPPQRRRAAPARYLGEVTGSVAWSAREKRQLLQLLQARRGQSEPDAAELARELPGRSEAEVRAFLSIERGWRRGKDVSGEGAGSKTRHGAWAGRARGWGPGHLSREERGVGPTRG